MEDWEKEEINKQLEAGRDIDRIKEELIQRDKKDELRYLMGKTYEDIIRFLKDYMDLRTEYYSLISLWVIGTYIHKQFETYPYLFINAMRGSGKTKLLKLIEQLSNNGLLLISLREAVLFRLPSDTTLIIDEFEGVNKKENAPLREILNASYKKGLKVVRMKKVKNALGEDMVIEPFEPYKPVCIANIMGLGEVLSDRCVTLILEKSGKEDISRYQDDGENNVLLKSIKSNLLLIKQGFSVGGVGVGCSGEWNTYVYNRYNYIHTQPTLTTLTTPFELENWCRLEPFSVEYSKRYVENIDNNNFNLHQLEFFNKIADSGIKGRNLELFFPLFLISNFLNEKVFEKTLKMAIKLEGEKKESEAIESKDVMVYDFISTREHLEQDFHRIKALTMEFRYFVGDLDEKEDEWLNELWFSRSLKRLDLISQKRRLAAGVEVILNVKKAKEQIKIFQQTKQ